MTNTATQFLGGNLLKNSSDILQTCNIEWFEQYSIKYLNIYAYILTRKHIYYLEVGSLQHVRSYFWWGGKEIEHLHKEGGGG